jgi:hypothetical protein
MTIGWTASRVFASAILDDVWCVPWKAPVNVLLVAPDDLAETFVKALRLDCLQPITMWHSGSLLVLPPAGDTGTLILRDVGALTLDDQRSLCDWLALAAGRTRVVSTSRQSLLPIVHSGAFSTMLYYRLNTLTVDVTECVSNE